MSKFFIIFLGFTWILNGCDSATTASQVSQVPDSHLTVERICQPITSLSCSAWPEQAQIIGKVASTSPLKSSHGEACMVTVTPSVFNAHMLCPMYETGRTVSYQVCGPCPQVGAEVSGVLMKDAFGRTVLDK